MNIEKELNEFENEPENIKSLVRNKPVPYWEIMLASNLLELRLANITKKYDALESGVQGQRVIINDDLSFYDWSIAINNKRMKFLEDFRKPICEDLQKSFGPQGKHGDAIQIRKVVDKIAVLCNKLLEIETVIRLIDPPHKFRKLIKIMEGITIAQYKSVIQWSDKLKNSANDLASNHPSGQYDLILNWMTSSHEELMIKEMKKITRDIKYSQSRKLFIDSNLKSAKTKKNNRTRTNIRQTVGLISKLLRMFK